MVKIQKLKSETYLFLLFIICLIFFSPFFFNHRLLTTKDNDLGRSYIPLYSFVHQSFYDHKQIPLWRPEQMMGETFIGSPLPSLLYPANILFIIFNANFGSILYLFAHFFLAGIFTFYLAKSFNLSNLSSFTAALFYAFSTKMLVHLEAGHITMIAAFSYFPLAFLSIRKLSQDQFIWLVTGATALTFMYFTYPTIFYYGLIFLITYSLYRFLFWFSKDRLFQQESINHFKPLALLIVITIGLSAVVLFPQLEFASLSTRSQLTLEDVAIPLWNIKKLVISLLFPYLDFKKLDHESFLYLGLVPIVFGFFGFMGLSTARKIFMLIIVFLTLLFVAGLSAPIFPFAYENFPLLKYSRVTTRLWFTVALIVALLSALALQKLNKKIITYFAITLFLIESFWIFSKRTENAPFLGLFDKELFEYISFDHEVFRIYCTTYCFNPQQISKYKIQTLSGETPLQHKDFINFLASAGNYSFNNFAVIFPPYQIWQRLNPPDPNAGILGLANVKYVASTYQINNQDFVFINKFDQVFLYRNLLFKPRVYFEDSNNQATIKKYSPNEISVNFNPQSQYRTLIFSENYYPGWIAHVNLQKYEVEKKDPIFRKVTVPPNTHELTIKYQPESFKFGKTITFSTISFIILWYIHRRITKLIVYNPRRK